MNRHNLKKPQDIRVLICVLKLSWDDEAAKCHDSLSGPRGEWIQSNTYSNTYPFAGSRGIDVMDVKRGWIIMVKGLIHCSPFRHQFSKGQPLCGAVA